MSGNTSKPSKAASLARVQALIKGLQQHFPNGSLTLGSVVYTTASLVQLLTELANAIVAVNTAELGAKSAVTVMRATRTKVGPIMTATRRQVSTMFSATDPTLADFGIEPPRARAPKTAAENAAAAAKAKATREARGTRSPKAKRAIKGNVVGVELTPVLAPAAVPPSPSPQPATSASNATPPANAGTSVPK